MGGWGLLLALILLAINNLAYDCDTLSFHHRKCGDVCLDGGGAMRCQCGEGRYHAYQDKWCCTDAACTKYGTNDGTCLAGVILNLTEACGGKCNSDGQDRAFVPCSFPGTTTVQCIRQTKKGDRVYDCKNRRDETPFTQTTIKQTLDLEQLLKPCPGWNGPGLTCSGAYKGCQELRWWCKSDDIKICNELNSTTTSLTTDPQVCGNQTFWSQFDCGIAQYYRCTGTNPGECWYHQKEGYNCADGSHQNRPLVDTNPDPEEPIPMVRKKRETKSAQEPTYCIGKLKCFAKGGRWKGQKICIQDKFVCDAIPQCIGGEDEADCKDEYVKKGTFTSQEKYTCHYPVINLTRPSGESFQFFTHRGVRCDGVPQCIQGDDEGDCDITHITQYAIPIALLTLSILGVVGTTILAKIFGKGQDWINNSKLGERIKIPTDESVEHVIEMIRKTNIRQIMTQLQALDLPDDVRRENNNQFLTALIQIEGGQNEAFAWMKQNLNQDTCQAILKDYDFPGSWLKLKLDYLADSVAKCKKAIARFCRVCAFKYNFSGLLKRFLLVCFVYLDMIKDTAVLAALMNIEKDRLIYEPLNFPSVLTWTMFVSIVLPLFISAVATAKNCPLVILGSKTWTRCRKTPPSQGKLWTIRINIIVFSFAIPALLVNGIEEARHTREKLLKEGKKQFQNSQDKTVSKDILQRIQETTDYLEEAQMAMLTIRRNELSMEITIQATLQLVMLLLDPETATHTGLQAVFQKNNDEIKDSTGFKSWLTADTDININQIFLVLSVLFSLRSAGNTAVKIYVGTMVDFFSFVPESIMFIRNLLVFAVRISCIVIFFGPSLGLLGCLSHWKANQLSPKPTPYTDYTLISLRSTCCIFGGLLLLQGLIIILMKRHLSPQFKRARWSSQLQHLIEAVNRPGAFANWHEGGGSPAEYKAKWWAGLIESIASIGVHYFSNLLLMVPLWITAFTVSERHQAITLPDVPFPEETAAFTLLNFLSWLMPIVILASSLIDSLMIVGFQKFVDPWRRIIAQVPLAKKEETTRALQEEGNGELIAMKRLQE